MTRLLKLSFVLMVAVVVGVFGSAYLHDNRFAFVSGDSIRCYWALMGVVLVFLMVVLEVQGQEGRRRR